MSKLNWVIIHDSDEEDGTPTCWYTEINHSRYGKFVWITLNPKGCYDVEVNLGEFIALKSCKSLASAKRWVTMNLMS